MTTQLPKERLESFIQNPLDNGLTRSEQMELARALLAAYEQEPDYLRYSCGCCGYESLSPVSACPKCNFDNIEETPLFMRPAPSIPAVPDALQEFESEDGTDIDYMRPSHVYKTGKVDGWNACRAAMLQAEPQSAPQNIPENIPAGYALVPIDATRAMIDAAERAEEDGYDAMLKAMLAAAPKGV